MIIKAIYTIKTTLYVELPQFPSSHSTSWKRHNIAAMYVAMHRNKAFSGNTLIVVIKASLMLRLSYCDLPKLWDTATA
jgi:hypothetical protein